MPSKRLIIVVDSAAELKSHWRTTLRDLLADIVRYLHQDGSTSQDPDSRKPQLGLIVYGSQGPCTETQVLPWGWTYDVNTFLAWLSAVRFTGGEFTEAALTNGLQAALKTIAAARDSNEVQILGETHCLLVTSYKSIPSLKHMKEYQILYTEKLCLQKLDRFLADATSVARKFVQSSVTLSIISPDQSPRLEELFTAGGNFNWLAQLYNPRTQNCRDERGNFNYLVLLSHNFMEAHTVFINRDLKIKPANDNYKGIDFGKYLIPSKETCPDGNVLTRGENFTEVVPEIQLQTNFPNRLIEIEVFLLGSDYDNDFIGRQNVLESSTSQRDPLTNNSSAVDDMMKSLQDAMYRPLASPIQYHRWTAPSKRHLGIGTSKDLVVKSECGKKIIASTITPYSCLSLLGVIPLGYAKAWEGDIMTVEEGETLFISRLVIYRKNSASEMFFNNWPNRVHMEQLIPKVSVDKMQFFGQIEWLLVDAMLPRSTIDKIERENLCGYIRLPNQTLLLHPFVRGSRFVAALYSSVLDIPSYSNFRK